MIVQDTRMNSLDIHMPLNDFSAKLSKSDTVMVKFTFGGLIRGLEYVSALVAFLDQKPYGAYDFIVKEAKRQKLFHILPLRRAMIPEPAIHVTSVHKGAAMNRVTDFGFTISIAMQYSDFIELMRFMRKGRTKDLEYELIRVHGKRGSKHH